MQCIFRYTQYIREIKALRNAVKTDIGLIFTPAALVAVISQLYEYK